MNTIVSKQTTTTAAAAAVVAAVTLTFLKVAEGKKGRGTKSLPPVLRFSGMFSTRSITAATSSAAGLTSIFVAVKRSVVSQGC